MKDNNLTIGLIATLLLASPLVGAEEQYPAANFEPVIVYQDTDYIGSQSASESGAQDVDFSETPAANFEPVVIYQDKEYIAKQGQGTAPKAPAAPKPAPAATPQAATPAPVTTTQAAPAASPSTSAAASEKSEGLLSGNMPIVLVALAVVGFVVWNSKKGAATAEAAPEPEAPYIGGSEGETGVAKYMRGLGMSSGGPGGKTGVAKYLETAEGAAKASGAGLTGVGKYLQNRDASAT